MFKLALSNLANCYLVIRVLNCQIQATSVEVFFLANLNFIPSIFTHFLGFTGEADDLFVKDKLDGGRKEVPHILY